VVRRSDLVDPHDGPGLSVLAARSDLLAAIGGRNPALPGSGHTGLTT
jgi:hypothetical protein